MNFSNLTSNPRRRTSGPAIRTPRPRAAALFACCILGTLSITARAANYVVDLNAPTVDKWQYPFGGSGGTRTNASTFGAVGSAGFDDRDAEFYTGFDTGSIVPAGLGAGNYVILSATFTLSMGLGPNGEVPDVIFDGTYDSYTTWGGTATPDDAGRPMELFGVGYRGGLSNTTVTNSSAFGPAGAPTEETRYLYPTDFAGNTALSGTVRDVSNNVANAFEAIPFAIGQVAPGELTNGKINEDANIVFTLNLLNPDVLRYLQLSLNEGRISLLTTSLHPASQGGPVTYPIYYTNENLLGGLPGRLDLQVQTVPEPGAFTMLVLGGAMFAGLRRGRRTVRPEEEVLG